MNSHKNQKYLSKKEKVHKKYIENGKKICYNIVKLHTEHCSFAFYFFEEGFV